ncbi:MAG TPA: hypothetical protein P5558_02950, partial [Geminicoccaceae bacterium]|nr:hypothetical protein [Geminicoccaceae bacterium]
YGLTETSSTIALLGSDDHREAFASDDPAVRGRLASVGRPLPSVEVSIRGYPTEITENELRQMVEPYPNVTYGGPYQKATELRSIYENVDLVWAIDLYDAGVNSDWLLPNRLYEAGFFGRPVIARAETAIGRFVADLQMGCVLSPPYDVACLDLLGQLSGDHYAAIVRWMEELPRQRFVLDEELREMTQNLLSPQAAGAVVAELRNSNVA